MNEACFVACADLVRRADPDRYFSALFAPAETRPLLCALYALNHELARVAESVSEPMLGRIRLQWWREALIEARAMKPRRHDVVEAMATVFSARDLPTELVDRLIDARLLDASGDQFADCAALEDYLDRTSGTLVRLAARILDGGERLESAAMHAGVAYGLVGIARSVAFHARRGKSFVPVSVLNAAGMTEDKLLQPDNRGTLLRIVREMASWAVEQHRAARAQFENGSSLAAFLPAALVPLYGARIRRRSFDPMRPEVGLHWRLATMLSAALRGRI